MTLPKFVFAHGWSYDSYFWKPLLQYLPHSSVFHYDEGYYQTAQIPQLPHQPYWAIGHSAGLMRLLKTPLPLCQGIISFNGFACFAQKQDFPHGVASRILERMHRQLAKHPQQIIENFRTLCGDHDTAIPLHKNIFQLQVGLETLLKEDYRTSLQHIECPLYDIICSEDPLSPARYGLSASLPTLNNLKKISFTNASFPDNPKAVGHLLPLTHPYECAKLIKNILMI